MYAYKHLLMNMWTKFQVAIFKNDWILPFWMSKKITFYAVYEDFGIFPTFFFLICVVQKVS